MPQSNFRSQLHKRLIETDRRALVELADAGRISGNNLTKKHRPVVRDWEGVKPTFGYKVTVNPTFVRVTVFARGAGRQKYRWVDLGTKPHLIEAVFKSWLTFQGGYSAKTAPGAKYNQGTGGRTGNWAKKKIVAHPGTEARKFSETFNEEEMPVLRRNTQNALRRAVRRKG